MFSATQEKNGEIVLNTHAFNIAGTRKLLVIDDQPGITRVVKLIANEMGIETEGVNLPARALDTFLIFRPDIVMIDMIMPEMDGIEILNEILLTGCQAHVILTTGFGEGYLRLAEALARYHDHERYSILRKPFRRDELADELNRCSFQARHLPC